MKSLFVTGKDGVRIAYDVTGVGPPLMLLHGAGKTRQDWHVLGYVDRLKNKFTVITVDIRGTGESDRRFEVCDYAIEKICADLVMVADASHAERFSVWGFSFGGNVARYLAARTNRVTALAIIGIPLGRAVDRRFDGFIAELDKTWGAAVRDYNNGRLNEKERGEIEKRELAVWLPCFKAMRDWPNIEPSDIQCPTMLVHGTKNEGMENWVNANRALLERAGIRVKVLEGLSHNQEFTEIDQVFPIVSEFLQDR